MDLFQLIIFNKGLISIIFAEIFFSFYRMTSYSVTTVDYFQWIH